MGARRLPASRRHGTHDGIASSCTDARAACACPLPRARPVSLSRPKCWQHGVVRHVEPSWDQGARAESARDGHSRPRMGTAVARARGGPPASPGSEASRGSICVSREKRVYSVVCKVTRLIFSHRPPTPLRSAPTRELPACRAYHVRHETNRKVSEPRLPPFTAVGWHTPRRSLATTTQTHTPPTRTSPGLGRGSCLSVW